MTPLGVPYNAYFIMYAAGQLLATYFQANGSTLTAGWVGPFATDVQNNMAGSVGHTSNFDFAKLTFALLQGWTYSAARVFTTKIQVEKSGELSQNSGNVLQMPLRQSVGRLNFPNDLDLSDFGGSVGKVLHVGLRSTEGALNQGVQDIRLDTKNWSKKRFLTDISSPGIIGGTHSRYYNDSTSPTGRALIWSGSGDRTKIYRINVTGTDADGLPIYDSLVYDINGVGFAAASNTGPSQFAISETLTANGMPVILLSKGVTTGLSCSILVNSTNAAAPDYGTFLQTTAIDATLIVIVRPRQDSSGRFYTRHNTGNGAFSRIVFNGTNNNAASLLNASNWARERLCIPVATTPAINGDGSTMQGAFDSCEVNEDIIRNGEPTIYVSDPTNFVIWQCQRNTNSFGDERDWDWTQIIGTGVNGGADGFGTLASIGQPRSMVYDSDTKLLYIATRGRHTIRVYNTLTTEVTTLFGVDASLGNDQQFDY